MFVNRIMANLTFVIMLSWPIVCVSIFAADDSVSEYPFDDGIVHDIDMPEYDDYEDEYDDEYDIDEVEDRLYYWNYSMYVFNDRLYLWLLKPTAIGYSRVIPQFGRESIRNFYTNIFTPVRFLNCLLQGKFKKSGTEVAAFAINTTLGIGGFRNPAKSQYEIEQQFEDLGQTLGVYGIGDGYYIVLPFLGPSSVRDTIGLIGDTFLKPPFYLPFVWSFGSSTVETINRESLRLGDYEKIKKASLFPYDSIRDIYQQYRAQLVKD